MSRTTPAVAALASELEQKYPDEWIAALANQRRMHLLEELDGVTIPADLEELARRIARREASSGDVKKSTIREIRISIYHNHLPRFADAGMLEYAVGGGRIEELEFYYEPPLLAA